MICLLCFSQVVIAESLAQQIVVENDYPYDAELIVTPSNGGATTYRMKPAGQDGDNVTVRLGGEKHTISSIIDGDQMDHDPVNLRNLIAGNDAIELSDIRTEVGEAPNGKTIYQAMPDYPYSRAYGDLVKRLKRSEWKGTYGNNVISRIKLNGATGQGIVRGDVTKLSDIEYVPGSKFYILGEWTHGNQSGEFVLIIDPKKPKQLKGHYRAHDDLEWKSGSAELIED